MIDQRVVESVIETANSSIVDIISDYVSLKRRGANYIGCCPFHNEKTGSFTVSASKGIYKCFGCGKAGNALRFVMDHDHLTFTEAIKHLGKRLGIEVQEKELTPEMKEAQTKRESMSAVMDFARAEFIKNLWETDEGQTIGLPYFRHRGFRDDTIKEFDLGYSMTQRNALTTAAINAGYKMEYLTETGLTILGENNYQADRFWGRVIFPIHNMSGKVIAFGGRVMQTNAKTAKYLNSPENELYHKSDVVYGIYQARNEIIKQDKCYLVEGYTDVISMHQSGITNVIASCGTSLTTNQIKLIQRFTNNMTVLYDGDFAGIKASLRGIDMILKEGMYVKVLLLPDGEDPDSFARTHTAEDFVEYINSHQTDFIQFKAQILLQDSANDPLKKSAAVNSIVDSIAVVKDLILREFYIKECAQLMDVREETLYSVLTKKLVADAQRNANDNSIRRAQTNLADQQSDARSSLANSKYRQTESPQNTAIPQSELEQAAHNIAAQEQQLTNIVETTTAAGETIVIENPNLHEETELLRFFLKYTQFPFSYGEPVQTSTVGQYIKDCLDKDKYLSKDPVFNNIMAFYDKNPKAELKNYIDSPDLVGQVDRIISLTSDTFELSRIHKRFGTIESETSQLDEFIPKIVSRLRLKNVEAKIEELSQELINNDNNAEALENLTTWLNVKKELSNSIGLN
ncbi:MAG: DNA primase [Bacteroidales bacterium]|nr:DNA primase [Bacteroidales bacterium]